MYISDAKFSSLALSNTSHLIHLNQTPILKKTINDQYRLNMNEDLVIGKDIQSSIPSPVQDSKMFYGDVSGSGNITAIDALKTLRIIQNFDQLEQYQNVNGLDRRPLFFAHSQNYSKNSQPTLLDVQKMLQLSAGIHEKLEYKLPTTQSKTIANSLEVIDSNWKLNAQNSFTFEFKGQSIAQLNFSTKITKSHDNSYNESIGVAKSPNWRIMYPSLAKAKTLNKEMEFRNLLNDHEQKHLKFMYQGKLQASLVPNIKGSGIALNSNEGRNCGEFWKFVAKNNTLTIYYKPSANSNIYYPQMQLKQN